MSKDNIDADDTVASGVQEKGGPEEQVEKPRILSCTQKCKRIHLMDEHPGNCDLLF